MEKPGNIIGSVPVRREMKRRNYLPYIAGAVIVLAVAGFLIFRSAQVRSARAAAESAGGSCENDNVKLYEKAYFKVSDDAFKAKQAERAGKCHADAFRFSDAAWWYDRAATAFKASGNEAEADRAGQTAKIFQQSSDFPKQVKPAGKTDEELNQGLGAN
jgi:hypothetical protein